MSWNNDSKPNDTDENRAWYEKEDRGEFFEEEKASPDYYNFGDSQYGDRNGEDNRRGGFNRDPNQGQGGFSMPGGDNKPQNPFGSMDDFKRMYGISGDTSPEDIMSRMTPFAMSRNLPLVSLAVKTTGGVITGAILGSLSALITRGIQAILARSGRMLPAQRIPSPVEGPKMGALTIGAYRFVSTLGRIALHPLFEEDDHVAYVLPEILGGTTAGMISAMHSIDRFPPQMSRGMIMRYYGGMGMFFGLFFGFLGHLERKAVMGMKRRGDRPEGDPGMNGNDKGSTTYF